MIWLMILQRTSLALAPFIITFLFVASSAIARSPIKCHKYCGTGKAANIVQYPFGFSGGCPIQLNCTDGHIRIGRFQVQNITPNGILINLPAECNRSVKSIRSLFGNHYALALRNSLLLQDCSKRLDGCFISSRSLEGLLNMSSCHSGSDKVNCYSPEDSGIDVLSYENVSDTQCKLVFSSVAISPVRPVVSWQFQLADLEWWIHGRCDSCDKNANWHQVRLGDGKVGCRCWCKDGFVGDGFAKGDGCRRVSDCNARRYMSGQCGGTIRVGVLVGGITIGSSLIAVLAFLCYCWRRWFNSLTNRLSAKHLLCEAAGDSSVPFYPYKEIERATTGFSKKQRLGTGAYGTVYAAKLRNDEWVAIKRIRHSDTRSIDQVRNEIKLLSSVSHPNLVRLLGCCLEETEPILVYEYMPNGTLCQHLQRERGDGLTWTKRLTIATETANAIAHLHSVMNPPIYHRDIKSSNILLDYNYRSKVADFGLSRFGMIELSHVSTAPQGTPGYLDPQYHQYFHLSDKSDVYSFGVVLVEIITALKVVDFSRPHAEVNLAALAIDRIKRGCVDEIADPYLDPHGDAWTLSSIQSVAELAFRCLAFHRDMRPTMREVAEELEHIMLSAWAPETCMLSPAASSCSSSDDRSEKPLSVSSEGRSGSRKLHLPQ